MIHVLVILIIAIVAGRDGVAGLPVIKDLPASTILFWSLLPPAVLAATLQFFLMWCGRRLDHSGRWIWLHLADGVLASSQYVAILFHLIAVMGLGWLDLIRKSLGGNLILVDEALAAFPPLLVLALGWASYYPIDRRLREATILRRLETTGRLPPMPTRWEYVWEQVRHHLLVVIIPVSAILAWTDLIDVIALRNADRLAHIEPEWVTTGTTLLHLVGVAAALTGAPFLMRYMWSTIPLGAGEIRDRLLALCREQGVRCRDLLVWRTHSNMVNGAVIGLFPAVRYILLTDTLLDQLPAREVEAVMAHEVAHARRHHLPWLMAMILAVVTWTWMLAATALEWSLPPELRTAEQPSPLSMNLGLLASLMAGVISFGWISRRFEQQADAFAAQHLSGIQLGMKRPVDRGALIQPEAAATMASALSAVCTLNNASPERFSFRHGSIVSRQRRLRNLISRPAYRLPIDTLVIILKSVTIAAYVALITLWIIAG